MNSLKNYHNDNTTISQCTRGNDQFALGSMRIPPQFLPYHSQHLQQKQQQYYFTEVIPRKPIASNKQTRSHANQQFSKSTISLTNFGRKQQQMDCCQNLVQIQQKITQQILLLREQKITLMEESNSAIQNRFRLQRDLNKLKKRIQDDDVQDEKYPIGINEQIKQPQRNFQKLQLQIITAKNGPQQQISQQQLQVIQKIKNLKKTIKLLESQLGEESQQAKIVQTSTQTKSPDLFVILKAKRKKLQQLIISQTKQKQLQQYLQKIMQSNRQLTYTLDYLFNKEKNKIKILKQKIEKQQVEKQELLQQLIQVKTQIKCLKIQNQQMKKALRFFKR